MVLIEELFELRRTPLHVVQTRNCNGNKASSKSGSVRSMPQPPLAMAPENIIFSFQCSLFYISLDVMSPLYILITDM